MTGDEIRYHRTDMEIYPVTAVYEYLQTREATDIRRISFRETADAQVVADLCRVMQEQQANLNISSLDLSSNGLKETNALEGFLRTNQTVRDLNLAHNLFGDRGLAFLLTPLQYTNRTLISLDLSDNHSQTADAVGLLLSRTKTLKALFLGYNSFGPRGIMSMARELTGNSSLETLALPNTNLGHRGMRHLANVLGNANEKNSIRFLDLSINDLGEKGMKHLTTILLFDKSIQRLWLSSNELGPNGAIRLSPSLSFNTTLVELKLGCNHIGDVGAISLMNAILKGIDQDSSVPLQKLCLDSNLIGDAGAESIANLIRRHVTLIDLDLSGNLIRRAGGIALARAVPYSAALRCLDLSRNSLCDQVAEAFATVLVGGNRVFETLHYEDAGLGEAGISHLEQAFQYRRNIEEWLGQTLQELRQETHDRYLNLLSRITGDYEVTKIAKVLGSRREPSQIASIYLGGCSISDQGIASLTSQVMLRPSLFPRLSQLYIRSSCMGDAGASLIARALPSSRSLRYVALCASEITEDGAQSLCDCLRRTCLKRLNLDRNEIGDEGLQQFIAVLQDPDISLRELSVAANGITDDGIDGLVTTRLTEVQLQDNCITDEGAFQLARQLGIHCRFQWLNLQGNNLTEEGAGAISDNLAETTVFAYH